MRRVISGWEKAAIAGAAVVLFAALGFTGQLGGWRAEASAYSARRAESPLDAADAIARAVAADPLLPRHRRELDRALERVIATSGPQAVESRAPADAVARSRFAAALAGASAGDAISRVARGIEPADRLEIEMLDRESLVLAARARAGAGRCTDAMPFFDAFAARSASTKRIDLDLGRCWVELGEPARALPLLERASANEPESRWPRLAHAEALLALARIGEADAETATLVRDVPDFYHGWYARGRVLLRANRGADAVRALERAAELAEKSEDPFWLRYHLAEARLAAGDPSRAAVEAAALTASRPSVAAGWELRGRALLGAGRGAEAREPLERALALEPSGEGAFWNRFHLAEAMLAANENERAAAATAELVRLRPDLAAVWTLRGRALVAVGKPAEAVPALEQAIARRARGEQALWPRFYLAEALLGVNDAARAEPISAALVTEAPAFSYGWQVRGRVLEALARPDDAAEAYRRALALRPASRWLSSRVEALAAQAAEARTGS